MLRHVKQQILISFETAPCSYKNCDYFI